MVPGSRDALEAVLRHAALLDDDGYDDIAPAPEALSACGDTSLVPRLREAPGRFLDDRNFYGRDLTARVLAGIQGVAALPALLAASARDIGDDQDSLQAEIVGLLEAGRERARRTVLAFATGNAPGLRRMGVRALGYVAGAQDLDLLAAAAGTDPRAWPRVVMLARDQDSGVRAAVLSGTAGTAGLEPEWAQLVAGLADDPDPVVRRHVALTVRHLAPDAARDILTRYATDRDQRVRQVASTGLGRLAGH